MHRFRVIILSAACALAVAFGGFGCSDTPTEPGEGGTQYAKSETAKESRSGVNLTLSFDSEQEAFTGELENTTDATVSQVRVEIHLSNGVELGPTPNIDLVAGETSPVELDASGQTFTHYSAHIEIGSSGS